MFYILFTYSWDGWLTGRGGTFREEQKKAKKRKRVPKATLSFADDEEEGDTNETSGTNTPNGDSSEMTSKKKSKLGKNPSVDTSFLPDREREEQERREREELRKEWLKRQEELKKEDIEITYSYWDGSGHRKSVTVSFSSVVEVLKLNPGAFSARKVTA